MNYFDLGVNDLDRPKLGFHFELLTSERRIAMTDTVEIRFFTYFLCALRIKTPEIRGVATKIHSSFIQALRFVQKEYPNFGGFDLEFNPLYGISKWLSMQIAYAFAHKEISRDLLTGIIITKDEAEAEETLCRLNTKTRIQFEFLAEQFLRRMHDPSASK